jgi:hypothetical protein
MGTIYVQFSEPTAEPEVLENAGTGAYGVDPWQAASADADWRAEQQDFAEMAAGADAEAIEQDN